MDPMDKNFFKVCSILKAITKLLSISFTNLCLMDFFVRDNLPRLKNGNKEFIGFHYLLAEI